MSPPSHWTPAEEKALVDFLHENRSEAGDGGNFKRASFQRAVQHIAPSCTNERPKDIKSCQNKWATFCKIYRTIVAIQSVSGWHWDDETGASITPETASSWDDYVQKHPAAKPFRNRGWVHLPKFVDIMPPSTPGTNVFHPSASQPTTTAPSPDIADPDDDDDDKEKPNKHERAREPATPTHTPAKRVRRSAGADALLDMSASFKDFGSKLAASLAPPSAGVPPTPRRRHDSIVAAQQLEKAWLTTRELVTFIEFLRKDTTAFDVYSALTEPDVRKEWVCMQLEYIGIGAFEHSL